LLNLRLRKAVRKGARVAVINPVDYEFNYPVAQPLVTDLMAMERVLAGVARALAAKKGVAIPGELAALIGQGEASVQEQAIAEMLATRARSTVLLGHLALSHPHAAILKGIGQFIADSCGAAFGMLPPANSAGAWLAGCVPHRGVAGSAVSGGKHAVDMLRSALKAYVLVGVEPELDCLNSARATGAMQAADFVVMLTGFKPSLYQSGAVEYADVWLPLAPFAETDGSFVNVEGRVQSFGAAVNPKGEARPGWKILRVLANHLNLPGFDQMTIGEVRKEIAVDGVKPVARLARFPQAAKPDGMTLVAGQVMRIADVPPYAVDAMTRRAPALMATADNPPPAARLNARQASQFGLGDGEVVRWIMQDGEARLPTAFDERVPDGCVLIASGYAETAGLGAHGPVSVVRETT
jgi:NADH-quinone oxidoreductase subunit G